MSFWPDIDELGDEHDYDLAHHPYDGARRPIPAPAEMRCPACGATCIEARDGDGNHIGTRGLYDEAANRTGHFSVSGGWSYWWGPTGGPYDRHVCKRSGGEAGA